MNAHRYGGEIEYLDLGKKAVLAFSRQVEGNTILGVFNLTKRESPVDFAGLFDGTETVLLHGQGTEVLTLRDHYNLMGMNVAEFSLSETEETQVHQLIYTGTHDNQTVKGWYQDLPKAEQKKIREKLAKYANPRESISKKMVRFVYRSNCALAIVPVADLLGLDDSARLNTPGTVGSPNWEWCLRDFVALRRSKAWVREVLEASHRV